MKTWTGKLAKKFHRDFQNTKLYSFQLEGEDRWFRTGKEEVPFNEGQTISFQEKNSQVLMDSIVEGEAATSSAPATEEKEPAATQTHGKAASQSEPTVGQRMAWEAARRDATRIVVAALEVEGKGLEVLPWAKNTAKNKRLDLLVDYVNKIASQLLEAQND